MKKLTRALAVAGVLLLGPRATAQEAPPVIGTITNRAGGEIVFTTRSTSKCSKQEARFAYIRDDGGKISLLGCWRIDGEQVFVFWDDGDTYSYPMDAIRFTEEWIRYSEAKDRGRGGPST